MTQTQAQTLSDDSSLSVSEAAQARIAWMRTQKKDETLHLRITIEGGGCSGFQYCFSWDRVVGENDHVFTGCVVTDSVSLPFLKGALVDFTEQLMGADFTIQNPNAKQGCGCGTSFSV